MPRFLHDWNDVRLLLACAAHGSFAKAASALGIDQSTASRRLKDMEAAVGRPLFHRRRSGATPTDAGLALIERARVMEAAAAQFDAAMGGLIAHPSPTVTVAASEGLLTYTVIPALLGPRDMPLSVDPSLIRQPLPDLAFTTPGQPADITLAPTNPGQIPAVSGAVRVRKVGAMNFAPLAHKSFLERHPVRAFDDMRRVPIVDNVQYSRLRALDDWNGLVADHQGEEGVMMAKSTPEMHEPMMEGRVATVGPNYTPLHRAELQVIDVPAPRLSIDLWLVAHEDALREPGVRNLFDSLADMFLKSPWHRPPR